MLKKTTLAILGMGVSSMVTAGMYATPPAPTCTPGDVTVPCEAKMWDLGVQALYLRPIFDADKGYNIANINQYREVDNDWGWGYRLEGSYHFSTGSDITMTWVHYDVDSNNGQYAGSFPAGQFLVNANYNLSTSNKFDQVNLVMGQHVDMGLLKNARFYGGLQYANIRSNGQLAYTVVSPAIQNLTRGVFGTEDTDFNGVGPVIGIDYSYDLTQNFSITANTAASILYGSARFSSGTSFGVGLVPVSLYAGKKAIVPSLEAKLGANYAYAMAQGILNIEAGYQALNYFNALENFNPQALILPGTGMRSNDFGLYGPYFGLKWLGNA